MNSSSSSLLASLRKNASEFLGIPLQQVTVHYETTEMRENELELSFRINIVLRLKEKKEQLIRTIEE